MDNQNNIQDELRSLNSGLPVNNSPNPFSIPEGYFDGLAAQILAKVKGHSSSAADELQELSPLLAGIPKTLPYSVPQGYFEENAALLSSLLKEEKSPVLAAIGKELPYSVPEDYFNRLPQQILSNLPRPQAKVVPFFSRTWMKAAVAAMIGGIVFIGGYRLLNNSVETMPTEKAYRNSDSTSKLVARNGAAAMVQDIQKVSTHELDEFMNAVPLNPAKVQRQAFQPTEKKTVQELLKDVPEKEIDAFLEQLPTADENLFIID